jgi:hypothetical protein
MVICAIGEPSRVEGWNCSSCDLQILEQLPKGLVFDPPRWHEGRIEASFVRTPIALIRALGIRQPKRLIALKQVDKIDIFLWADDQLHLFEVKGLKGPKWAAYGKWHSAQSNRGLLGATSGVAVCQRRHARDLMGIMSNPLAGGPPKDSSGLAVYGRLDQERPPAPSRRTCAQSRVLQPVPIARTARANAVARR